MSASSQVLPFVATIGLGQRRGGSVSHVHAPGYEVGPDAQVRQNCIASDVSVGHVPLVQPGITKTHS